jgi:hypothetical protein
MHIDPPRCGLPVAACPGKDFLPVEFDTEAPRCEALAVEREKRRLVSEAKVKWAAERAAKVRQR